MRSPQERLDAIRKRSSERENHLIDELRAKKIGRREFVRRAATAGMALPLANFVATACGQRRDPLDQTDDTIGATPKPGGTFRIGQGNPETGLEPAAVNSQNGLAVLGHSGDYLIWSDRELVPQPRLATKWEPNDDGTVWRFTIREGVKFHDGRPMDAEDVAATFNRLSDPEMGSNALSVFAGVLGKDGAKAIDPRTVEFTLDAPNGNFPFLCSSDNYNSIILPKDYDGDWQRTFIGTGAWKLESYRPGEGITYVPNREYWDTSRRPIADKLQVQFYSSEQALVLAFQGNQVDHAVQFSVSGGKALLTDPTIVTTELRSSAHREIHIRCDGGPNGDLPIKDKRVRQAMALLVNRTALVEGLLDTKTDYGNDSPFAPVFPATSTDVKQRQQDVAKARQLLEAAGVPDGFEIRLETWAGFEMPDLAQLLQQDLRAGNIRVNLTISDQGTYFGDAQFGNSRWLDSNLGITEYGHRGVPNVFLNSQLHSKGSWNAAHFKNQRFDRLMADYVATIDLETQRRIAKEIQELLLDEVPCLYTYFYNFLSGTKDYATGVDSTAMGCVDASRAGFV